MLAKPGNDIPQLDHGAQSVLQSTVFTEPWWKGVSNNSVGEAASESSSMENGAVPSQTHAGVGSGDERNGKDGQHLKSVPSAVPLTSDGHLEPNSQMKLVDHSIVLTSYPCSDPLYGGILNPYGPQTMVSPHLYGVHHSRMPLPLQMEEEPVYVNAKQYHGILRRRQIRAKAELEKKVIKVKKPYLHESRHLHAMRRARGLGGRFINTKNLDNDITSSTSKKGMNLDANLSTKSAQFTGSMHVSSNDTASLKSFYAQQENRSLVQDFHRAEALAKVISNDDGLLSTDHTSSNDGVQGTYFDR